MRRAGMVSSILLGLVTLICSGFSWSPGPGMHLYHDEYTQTLLLSGKVLVLGGIKTPSTTLVQQNAEAFLVSKVWADAGVMSVGRAGHTATVLEDGSVLVAGGYYGQNVCGTSFCFWSRTALSSTEIYLPGVDRWDAGVPMNLERYGHRAIALDAGRKVFVIGGVGNSSMPDPTPEIFDHTLGGWRLLELPPVALQRDQSSAQPFPLSSGEVLVLAAASTPCWKYHLEKNKWLSCARPSLPLSADFGAILLATGRVLMVASSVGTIYSPDEDRWAPTAPLKRSHPAPMMVKLNNGRVLVVDRAIAPPATQLNAEIFIEESESWLSAGTVPSGLSQVEGATLLPSGGVLFTSPSSPADQSWLFEPVNVIPRHVTIPPGGTVTLGVDGGRGPYSWTVSVSSSGAGSISQVSGSGIYTAGRIGGVRDVVQVTDDGGTSDIALIDIGPGVSISPTSVVVPPNGVVTLVASGGSGAGFVWSLVSNASQASVDGQGRYVAGRTGNVSDVIKATDSLGNSATALVSVSSAMSVFPSGATVLPGTQVAFRALGGSGTGYAWRLVTDGSGGSVDQSSGLYSSGARGPATDVVEARDSLGNVARASVGVLVAPPQPTPPAPATSGCSSAQPSPNGGIWLAVILLASFVWLLRANTPR